uniref:MARVEL domain-containing protein n=1 Tax=Mesocestoides corti TaxID=53468 RepID=A0A5K3FHB1_MESCO
MIVAAAFSPYSSAAVAAAVFCALLSLAYLIEAMVRFSIRKTNNQITVITRGVITTGQAGPAFQPAPTEPPPSDPMGRSAPYPTDSYGMP